MAAFLLLLFGILSVNLVEGSRCVVIARNSALFPVAEGSASLDVEEEESEPWSWENET